MVEIEIGTVRFEGGDAWMRSRWLAAFREELAQAVGSVPPTASQEPIEIVPGSAEAMGREAARAVARRLA